MKLADTVIGDEYWFFSYYGPYRTKGIAVGAARRVGIVKRGLDSYLYRVVRVSDESELTRKSLSAGSYYFNILEEFDLEPFGVTVG